MEFMKDKKIDQPKLLQSEPDWPTHIFPKEFWENLGRTIGTFGLLEEVLVRAVFVITGMRRVENIEKQDEEFKAWIKHLENTLSDPLGHLIKKYERAIKENPEFSTNETISLIQDLKAQVKWRNLLCHCSWRIPNSDGESIPLYRDKSGEIFDSKIDMKFITGVRSVTITLICRVMDSITERGYDFPGTVDNYLNRKS